MSYLATNANAPKCDYTFHVLCSETDCFGENSPTTLNSPSSSTLYVNDGGVVATFIDINSNTRYVSNGANTWTATPLAFTYANLSDSIKEQAYPLLPPLVNLEQINANQVCSVRDALTSSSINGLSGGASISSRLPRKVEQVGYSAWDNSLSASSISGLETGSDLNSASRCNSNSASGFSSYFTDSALPGSAATFTLPGTASSSIRSLVTGSTQTASCVSRYGVQDHVGNIKEWATDQVTCGTVSSCIGRRATDNTVDSGNDSFYDSSTVQYAFDGSFGPCIDSDNNGSCDSTLGSWVISTESYSSGRYAYPMSLPVRTSYTPTTYFYEIGPTSGIKSDDLHGDSININAGNIYGTDGNCGGLTTGGDYNDGSQAGRYNTDIQACNTANVQTGLRCVQPITNSDYATDTLHNYSY